MKVRKKIVRGTSLNHEPSHSDDAKAIFAEAIEHGKQIEFAEEREDWFGENNTGYILDLVQEMQKLCVQARIADADARHEGVSNGM